MPWKTTRNYFKEKKKTRGDGIADLIKAGIALVVGTIVLVIVANVIDQSINADIGATAFIVVGFITVGLALGLLVRSFATVSAE